MVRCHVQNIELYNSHYSYLLPLGTGDSVLLQNRYAPYPKRWMNSGIVVEVLPNCQYRIKVDGSNRVTLRNRRFIKKITPVCDIPCTSRYAHGEQELQYQHLSEVNLPKPAIPLPAAPTSNPEQIMSQPEPTEMLLEPAPTTPA